MRYGLIIDNALRLQYDDTAGRKAAVDYGVRLCDDFVDAVSAAVTEPRFSYAFFLQFFDRFSDAFVVGFDQMRSPVDGGYGFVEVCGYRCRHIEYTRMRAADDDRKR